MVSGSRSTRGRVATKANPFDPGPLPAYISAPRLERMGMKTWKTVQFRQIQGARNAKKSRLAKVAPRRAGRSGREPSRIQRPQTGRKRSSVAFESEMRPQRA